MVLSGVARVWEVEVGEFERGMRFIAPQGALGVITFRPLK